VRRVYSHDLAAEMCSMNPYPGKVYRTGGWVAPREAEPGDCCSIESIDYK